MEFKVLFNCGIPYEENFKSIEDLSKGLKDFYLKHKDEGYFYDVEVFNNLNEDISESQFITELIGGFLE